MNTALTPMERAILELVRNEHWTTLDLDEVGVARREHTGVGRYTYFVDRGSQSLRDGSFGAGAHYVEMMGVPNGLFFIVEVEGGRLSYLEVVSAGADEWDGVERPWQLV